MASSYSPEEAVSLAIDLKREDGSVIENITGVDYAVIDHNDVEKQSLGPVSGFTPGDQTVAVTIPAIINALDEGTTRGMRIVRLRCTANNGVVEISDQYLIQKIDTLKVMDNSIQTYASAEITAMDMSNLTGWDYANKHHRLKAMVDAYERICQMAFDVNSAVVFDDFPGLEREKVVRVRDMDAAKWSEMPGAFKDALAKAQVAEADFILQGINTAEAMSKAGFLSRTIGESSMMLKSGNQIHYPICQRAVGYLSRFMAKRGQIGRS